MKAQPSLLSFSSPLGSQNRFLPSLLIETLVCMPLPLTPTTGLGRKQAVKPILCGHLAADQFVELDLVGGGDDFAIAVIDFELRRRDFGMVLFILEAHGALHFGGGVDESAQRIAGQRVVIAAGIDVFELAGFVIVALGVGALEEEAFDFVGGVERVAFFFVKLLGVAFQNAADIGAIGRAVLVNYFAENQNFAGAEEIGGRPVKSAPIDARGADRFRAGR